MPPHPGPLSNNRLAPDGFRLSGRQYPVQHRHANGSLGLLGRETKRSQPRSDQRLVATHCRFYERTPPVARGGLPGQAALFRDHLQMAIALPVAIATAMLCSHSCRASPLVLEDGAITMPADPGAGIRITRACASSSGASWANTAVSLRSDSSQSGIGSAKRTSPIPTLLAA
jgi:hypothetical protein